MPEKKNTAYRYKSDSWSEDDSSSTSSDSDFFQMLVESSISKNIPETKTRGDLELDDLSPIQDISITIPKEDMMLIGKIHAVVDKLVVVHALKDMKILDFDSVLFLTHDKPLGRVYDVFGPVVEPFYCIRFNCVEDINEKIIDIGADVFFAPEKNDITSYVFVNELQKEKGSDASWKNNNEPPEEFLDFSDDEQEKAAKRKRRMKNRNRQFSSSFDMRTKKPFIINSQQNLNSSPENCLYPSLPPPSPMPSDSRIFTAPRFTPFTMSYSRPPPSPTPLDSSIFTTPRFTPFSMSYPPPSLMPSESTIFTTPRFTPFSMLYPHPPSSPILSDSSIFTAPRFTSFSMSCPPPSASSVTGALRYTPYPSLCPLPPPSPSFSETAVSSSYSNPYPPLF